MKLKDKSMEKSKKKLGTYITSNKQIKINDNKIEKI
jgi:hypothetical protein